MAADKRNASVVIVLIFSMTVGLGVLLCLESWLGAKPPLWSGDAMLAAERGESVAVEIAYVGSAADVAALGLDAGANDSICVIGADGEPAWKPAGPIVRIIVIGSEGDQLPEAQQRTLLAVIGALSQASGVDVVGVRLAAPSDVHQNPSLPAQAGDLRALLERKRIID